MSTTVSTIAPSTTTAPPPRTIPSTTTTTAAPDPATLLVVGDFGSGAEAERRVASTMERLAESEEIDAFVTTGDNLYYSDVEATWQEPFGWVEARDIPVFAAWGNHDIESSARRSAVAEALDPPGRWYRERIEPATLIVLDANRPSDPEQLAWLEETLASSPAGPIVVSFHQPAYSCSLHGSTDAVVDEWLPRFEGAGVDLVLNGHDHNYQRFETGGITYVVTGGGGHVLYQMGTCPAGTPDPVVSDDTHHHFLIVTASVDQIRVKAITDEEEVIDDHAIPLTASPRPGDHPE